MMNAITLTDVQSSIVAMTCQKVVVRDPVGALLGHFVPKDTGGSMAERWVECWSEWYAEPEAEDEEQLPETD